MVCRRPLWLAIGVSPVPQDEKLGETGTMGSRWVKISDQTHEVGAAVSERGLQESF